MFVFLSSVEEIKNEGADGDFKQTPLTRQQAAQPGCQSGMAGRMCLSG